MHLLIKSKNYEMLLMRIMNEIKAEPRKVEISRC